MVWRWKGKEVGEVKKFKYLGYTLMRKGAAVMGQLWGLGKRICSGRIGEEGCGFLQVGVGNG